MNHFVRSTLIVAVFFGLEKLLGFVRQILMAKQFGLSAELDAFNAANNLPDLLFALISGGALAMAFIPVLSEYLEKGGRPAAWDLFSRITNLVFLATTSISILLAILAEPLVRWVIVPGFDPTQQAIVASLMRLNLISTLLFSMGGLAVAGLQANQHFFLPALAPSMYDIGALFGVLVLAPETGYRLGPVTLPAFGLGIYGVMYGVILGAGLFLAIQIPGLLYFRFRWKPAVNLRNPGVQQVLYLMGPRILTVFFINLVFLAQDNFASRLAEGSVAALVYGWLFMQVPESLIGTAIGTVLLPTISEQIARGDSEVFRRSLNEIVKVILALTIPSAALLAVGIRPVVGMLGFDAAGTELVVWTTRGFLLGIVGHSLLEVASRSFYAQQDARTPLLASGLTVLFFILFAFVFTPALGAPGIGLANSLAFTGEALLLLILLNRQYPAVLRVGGTLARVVAVSAGAAAMVYYLMNLPLPALPLSIAALAAGGLVVLPFIWKEVRLLIQL